MEFLDMYSTNGNRLHSLYAHFDRSLDVAYIFISECKVSKIFLTEVS